MKTWKVLERRDETKQAASHRKVEPDMAVPSWAASVVKETGYTEIDVFHKAESRWTSRSTRR